jgi:small subunit ribosomal protein S6
VSNYELVYIVSPTTSEEEIPKILGKVSEYITKVGGTVVEVVQWGRKRLTYPIKKFGEGNYVLTRVEIKPEAVKGLEASLKLSNEIIRYLVIKSAS